MAGVLSSDQLRFINLVAARRFAGRDPEPDAGAAVPQHAAAGDSAFRRAAAVAASAARGRAFTVAPGPTALLAMCCQLANEGFELLAPQGAAAGMISGLRAGRVDEATVARWIEDRAVPMGSLEP